MEYPQNFKFTKDHEWIRVDGNVAYVGITDYAQEQLGDIVFIEIETLGQTLSAEQKFGTIEAVKTVSDMYMPISGEILEINQDIISSPEKVNQNAHESWMVKVEMSNPAELNNLLSKDAYLKLIGA